MCSRACIVEPNVLEDLETSTPPPRFLQIRKNSLARIFQTGYGIIWVAISSPTATNSKPPLNNCLCPTAILPFPTDRPIFIQEQSAWHGSPVSRRTQAPVCPTLPTSRKQSFAPQLWTPIPATYACDQLSEMRYISNRILDVMAVVFAVAQNTPPYGVGDTKALRPYPATRTLTSLCH